MDPNLKLAEFSDADKGAELTPGQHKQMEEAVHDAGVKARAEASMVATQAQRLFYEYWNAGGHEAPLQEGISQFDKCMRMADEIRKIVTSDFANRVKRCDEEIKKKIPLGKDGKPLIILPSAKIWEAWRLPGQ